MQYYSSTNRVTGMIVSSREPSDRTDLSQIVTSIDLMFHTFFHTLVITLSRLQSALSLRSKQENKNHNSKILPSIHPLQPFWCMSCIARKEVDGTITNIQGKPTIYQYAFTCLYSFVHNINLYSKILPSPHYKLHNRTGQSSHYISWSTNLYRKRKICHWLLSSRTFAAN